MRAWVCVYVCVRKPTVPILGYLQVPFLLNNSIDFTHMQMYCDFWEARDSYTIGEQDLLIYFRSIYEYQTDARIFDDRQSKSVCYVRMLRIMRWVGHKARRQVAWRSFCYYNVWVIITISNSQAGQGRTRERGEVGEMRDESAANRKSTADLQRHNSSSSARLYPGCPTFRWISGPPRAHNDRVDDDR